VPKVEWVRAIVARMIAPIMARILSRKPVEHVDFTGKV
jgi:hypothetical protein